MSHCPPHVVSLPSPFSLLSRSPLTHTLSHHKQFLGVYISFTLYSMVDAALGVATGTCSLPLGILSGPSSLVVPLAIEAVSLLMVGGIPLVKKTWSPCPASKILHVFRRHRLESCILHDALRGWPFGHLLVKLNCIEPPTSQYICSTKHTVLRPFSRFDMVCKGAWGYGITVVVAILTVYYFRAILCQLPIVQVHGMFFVLTTSYLRPGLQALGIASCATCER